MTAALRYLFYLLVVRPMMLLLIGLNVRNEERLPRAGPAVIAANHNSHLDAFALMTLFPQRMVPRLRPVAASDYFLKNRTLAWFALQIVGIIPISRTASRREGDPLGKLEAALDRGEILIFFPEGTRGTPEQRERFRTGIAHLMKRRPNVPVVPIFLHGLGKALPRGESLLVPFFCDVFVGPPVGWAGDRQAFMDLLEGAFDRLAEQARPPEWS